MTHKDYIAIAKSIAHTRQFSEPKEILGIDKMTWDLCVVFKADHRNFDQTKFLKACGIIVESIQ